VTTTLTVKTGSAAAAPSITSAVTVRAPATWAEVTNLRKESRENEGAYRVLLLALLDRLGLFDEYEAYDIVGRASDLPKPEVRRGIAAVSFVAEDDLAYYDASIGPWYVKPDGTDFEFGIHVRPKRLRLAWRAEVRLEEGIEIETSEGPVVEEGSRFVRWKFLRQSRGRAVSVRADPSERVTSTLYSESLRWYLRGASRYVVLALVPLLVLVLGRPGVLVGGEGTREVAAVRRARRLAAATVVVAGAELVIFTVTRARSWIESLGWDEYYGWTVVSYGITAAATVAIALVLPRLVPTPTRRTYLLSAATAAAVLAASAPLTLTYWPSEELPDLVPRSSAVLNVLSIGVVVVLATHVVLSCLAAIRHFMRQVNWSTLLAHIRPPRVLRGRTSLLRRLRAVVALGVALAIPAYWFRGQYDSYERDAAEDSDARLSDSLQNFPVEVIFPLGDLLRLLILFALVAVLAAVGSRAEGPILGPQRRLVAGMLSLAFAGWAVGLGGSVSGFAFPLPGVIALLALMWFTRPHLESREAAIARENPSNEGSSPPTLGDDKFRDEMLARTRAIIAARGRKKALYAQYRAGDLTEEAYHVAYSAAQHREKELRKGGLVATERGPANQPSATIAGRIRRVLSGQGERSSVAPPSRLIMLNGCSPFSFAVSLGPRPTWWRNGVFAGILAAPLSIVPLLYYASSYDVPDGGFAPFYVGVAFTEELARWVVAGLVFGCCYAYLPGRVGLVKAVTLMAGIVISVAFLSLIPGVELPPRLASNVALLTLFLVVVGALMDWRTLSDRKIDARHLGELYELHALKKAAVLAPIAFGILGIAHEIASGEWGGVRDLFSGFFELIKSL
jgi:hypothetical protein